MTLFPPVPDARELIASTSDDQSVLEFPILSAWNHRLSNQTSSTRVTMSMRASSNVCKRFGLMIKCLSNFSSTNASRPANLVSWSKVSFNFFSKRGAKDSHRSTPAWSSNRDHLPREKIVRSKFVVFRLSSDHIVSEVFTKLLPGASASCWRQCHWSHSS